MRNARGIFLSAVSAVLTAAAMMALPSSAQAQADKTFVMKLGVATINDIQHEWLKRFVAAVEKDSNGRIKGEIYPASQLGPIPRMIEGVQFGSIQGWIGPLEFLVGVDVRYEALSAPGLMNNFDQMVKLLFDPAVQKMMFGLGAGWANVPALNLLMGAPLKLAVGTSGFALSVVDTSAAWVYINRGAVLPVLVAPSIVGVMLGAKIGARLLRVVHAATVRRVVIGLLLAAGARALLKGLGIWN